MTFVDKYTLNQILDTHESDFKEASTFVKAAVTFVRKHNPNQVSDMRGTSM